jgi:hypothetical protein
MSKRTTFAWWYRRRNGSDGRRPSGVGYTESKIHIVSGDLEIVTRDYSRFKTLCGCSSSDGYFHKTGHDLPQDWPQPPCRRCEMALAKKENQT